jgi:hypothetical protein
MVDLSLVGKGILTTETMLRTAQAEIDDLKGKLAQALTVVVRLERQVQQATLTFCALAVQYGGTATISRSTVIAGLGMVGFTAVSNAEG